MGLQDVGLRRTTERDVGSTALAGRPTTGYRLTFAGADGQPELTLPASDASSALILAQRHGKGRKAELWRGDKLVCRIAEDQFAGFWEIG
jgi:hypothetical protein